MNKKTYQVKFTAGLWEHVNNDEKDFIELTKKWAGKYGEITLDISSQKSNRQNRYFHGVLIPHFLKAIRDAGYNEIVNDKDAKDLIKGLFFKLDPIKIGKKEYPRYASTCNADWDTECWEAKMSQIRAWTFDKLNYEIPEPNEG